MKAYVMVEVFLHMHLDPKLLHRRLHQRIFDSSLNSQFFKPFILALTFFYIIFKNYYYDRFYGSRLQNFYEALSYT